MKIRLSTIGKIIQGDEIGTFIEVVDDSENTGGFLIFKCRNVNFEGEVFDAWVENRDSLERYFVESNWEIEWTSKSFQG